MEATTAKAGRARRFKRGEHVRLIDNESVQWYDLKVGDVGLVNRWRGWCLEPGDGAPSYWVDFYDGSGELCVAEHEIASAPGPFPRFTRLEAMDAVDRLFQRTRGRGTGWRRLETLLGERRARARSGGTR